MRMKSAFIAVLAAASLVGFVGPVRAITLADLIANHGTIQQGDKLFSNFEYTKTSNSAMPDASQINVVGQTLNGNNGLYFQAGWGNSTPFTSLDSQIQFDVEVTDPNYLISDVHLIGNPNVTGGSNSLAQVVETVTDPNNHTYSLYIQDQIQNGVHLPGVFDASIVLNTPVSKLHVVKDAQFIVGADGSATMSYLANYYSQTSKVPEPGSIAMLFGVAISGSMFGLRLRRNKRA